jgi:hypothetical protein
MKEFAKCIDLHSLTDYADCSLYARERQIFFMMFQNIIHVIFFLDLASKEKKCNACTCGNVD